MTSLIPTRQDNLILGSFVTSTSRKPQRAVELALESEAAGLDVVTFQDHPYQPRLLDAWTLLSYVAARTEHIHIASNVLNLPLRPPTVLARAAASLDLLTGGRFELGIGAGGIWPQIETMGVRRLTPSQATDALSQAIDIIRAMWDVPAGNALTADGDYYQVAGAARGPAPAHDIGLWVGAYRPRMLRLTGAKADAWLPSLPYLGSLEDIARAHALVDEGALTAGRDPASVRRLLNIPGHFGAANGELLSGPAKRWVEQLVTLTISHRFTGYLLWTDDSAAIARFGHEVAPALREAVGTGTS